MRRYPRASSRQRCWCLRFSKQPRLPRERGGPRRYSPIVATGAVDTAIAARRDAAREAGTASNSARTTLAVLTDVGDRDRRRTRAARAAPGRRSEHPNPGRAAGRHVRPPRERTSPRGASRSAPWSCSAGPGSSSGLAGAGCSFASAAAAAAWAVSLALVDGVQGLTSPLEARTEYLADVATVGSPGAFLSTFVDRIGDYSIHVQGHPPGMLLLLSALDRVGLGGSGWAAALCIAAGAAAVPAVLVAVREVAGEEMARRATPFLVITPAAIWIATSADAFFMGVSAWAVTLVVLATGRHGRRSDVVRARRAGCSSARRPSCPTGSCSSRWCRPRSPGTGAGSARLRSPRSARRRCSSPSSPPASGGSPASSPPASSTSPGSAHAARISTFWSPTPRASRSCSARPWSWR